MKNFRRQRRTIKKTLKNRKFSLADQFDAEKMKEKRRQWRKMLKELGKHFGFLSLLLAYTALGGGIFWQLEAKFDQKIRKEIENDLKSHLRHWCQILENSKPIDVCVEILLNQLNFNASLMLPKELKANSMPWDFMHAMFFASTVYSTIGM